MQMDSGRQARFGILKRAVDEKIVGPLQTHGWYVSVDPTFHAGEFILVAAERAGAERKVAVLYSSGTDNHVYKQLAAQVDHIFFNGEPYNLEAYAFGISKPVGPLRDFPSVMLEWNRETSPGKFAPGTQGDDGSDVEDDGPIRLLAENPADAIWLRLKQFHSVSLARKLVEKRFKRSSAVANVEVIESKAEGVTFALRNATDYYQSVDDRNISQRVLNLYYGTMSFAIAEMMASPTGTASLAEVEASTKLGHGLYTFDGSSGGFHDMIVGGLASGFFTYWQKTIGQPLQLPAQKPKKAYDVSRLSADSYVTLEALFARIPEVSDLFIDIFDRPAMWLLPTFDQDANSFGQANSGATRTYVKFLDASARMKAEDVAKFPGPISEITALPAQSGYRVFRAAVDYQGLKFWWEALSIHRSPFTKQALIMPVFGSVTDFRAICFVLLYGLSIVVRYRPSLWRRIQEGDLDNVRALIEAFLAVAERVLPQEFLEHITGQQVLAHQPGSFFA
jgi:hypothetical protein